MVLQEARVYPQVDVDELIRLARNQKSKNALGFIKRIANASLDDPVSKLTPETIERLRNPPQEPPTPLTPLQKHSIRSYFALEHSSRDTFEKIRVSEAQTFADADGLLHFEALEKLITEITGVSSIEFDMCWDTCLAFTGPFENDQRCSQCGRHRYDQDILKASGKRVSRKFHTIPLGPILQALFRDRQTAEDLSYRVRKTHEVLEDAIRNGRIIQNFDDYICGTDYIQSLIEQKITDDDIVVMASLDGAQLLKTRGSDCWMYIWVILEFSPDKRYKKTHVFPGGFIPGPKNPRNVDSFLFPGYHHVSALQREGLGIWNASQQRGYKSHIHHFLATADGPGLTYFNGMCGHCGKNGCRMYCGVLGRRKTHGKNYYPALSRPDLPYDLPGSNHADISVYDLPPTASTDYYDNLKKIVSAKGITAYDRARRDTGLTKPSILLGLHPKHTLQVPRCLAPDQMHLVGLLANLFVELWRGEIDHGLHDHPETWPFAVLRDENVWAAHGLDVEMLGMYIPGLFDHKARNIQQELTSGYRTFEFEIWLLGYVSALMYELLPLEYWMNICKLIRGFRIISQHSISLDELLEAQRCFMSFYEEYERLYYQKREDRLHFIRHSIHQVTHLVDETIAKGPPICYAQWTMERTIGNLGREIRQPSNPYENYSREGVRRCAKNGLKAMFPELDPPPTMSSLAEDVGDGYFLLRARDRYRMFPTGSAHTALARYMGREPHRLRRWARLHLPNGQITRSAWRENATQRAQLRIARNIKYEHEGRLHIGEVIYYTQIDMAPPSDDLDAPEDVRTVAVIWKYSEPDPDLLRMSSQTLWTCRHLGEESATVIDVRQIKSLIAMPPHCPTIPSTRLAEDRFFLVEKPGFDVATYIGDPTDLQNDDPGGDDIEL
ncbi:hypothetical protein CONPUDRAFT_53544 [Coniophora puteana RWD-64-598 SS2]|uniref:Uncharacterized protein n=1 Tax=Coniophora puteana (strain RWD-64-598) TaxID=741705 RepID=R7SDM4_CONPW|nr:uncharacterized protein CONPUDRAFT_53544 [Coniophora puteana RWD-64-598 SS2]XP_007775959.1 uncharacterized protein CONPUDRAFT_68242 [Coniophora puteana RWD-64-598 SS2]EIW73862.1 hypothetical protein CONPUDRAFT_68242 [Coniophora puteana RWD-64-598 SS2]EIW81793.1 hypothetical protein CONPUDRAFT_53544 [Coniophora puteana RWD-64-598 SS2]